MKNIVDFQAIKYTHEKEQWHKWLEFLQQSLLYFAWTRDSIGR